MFIVNIPAFLSNKLKKLIYAEIFKIIYDNNTTRISTKISIRYFKGNDR